MKKTRCFACLLAILMLCGALLISCQKKPTKDPSATDPIIQNPPKDSEEIVKDDVPEELVFTDRKFNVFLGYGTKDFWQPKEEGTDLISSSTWRRNQLVEERLEITLNFKPSGNGPDGASQGKSTQAIRTYAMDGECPYEAYVHVQHGGMPGVIADDLLLDWNQLPYVDFDKPYWYSNCLRDINYGTRVYAMNGDYNLSTFCATGAIMFNETMMINEDVDLPYQDVIDGNWTYEKFYDLILSFRNDIDGDGYSVEKDTYGYAGWGYEMGEAIFMGMGGDMVTKGEQGVPVLAVNSDINKQAIDNVVSLFLSDGVLYEMYEKGNVMKMFVESRLLFADIFLEAVPQYRSSIDFSFGFLPNPKLDGNQKEYISRTPNVSCMTYIPKNTPDLNFTGAVLEVLSSTSYHTTIPAYFDVVLSVRSLNDNDAQIRRYQESMLQIIRSSASYYDCGLTAFGIQTVINESLKSNQNSFASVYEGVQDQVEQNIQELIGIYCK